MSASFMSRSEPLHKRLAYEALDPLGGAAARVRFHGRLQGRAVLWEARLRTLADVYAERLALEKLPAGTPLTLRQYIHIDPAGEDERCRLEVGLAVPCIDVPTVFKTLIMINNYKRLAPGRHEYGPGHTFPLSE